MKTGMTNFEANYRQVTNSTGAYTALIYALKKPN